jgi:uncharacterized membrane protein
MNKLYKNEDGAVLPIVALLLTFVLIGLSALVVDVGFLYAERRSMVTAADAAALGGAKVLQEALSDPTAVQSVVESNAIKVATDLALANGVKNESDIKVKIEMDTHYNSKVIKV